MCIFTSAQYEYLVLDNDQNDWVIVSKKEKKTKKIKHKAYAIDVSYLNDHLKTNPLVKGKKLLNRKDRRRQPQRKKLYDTIHIPNVPGRSELDLSAEVLEALNNIPKVAHHTSKKYKGCQKKTKRMFPVFKVECVNCGKADHHMHDCYYRPSNHLVGETFRDECPDPNPCDLPVSIDDPKFGFVFPEAFNEYLQQEKLKKDNSAELLNGKKAKAHQTGNYSDLIGNCEEWMYLKNKQTHPEKYPLSYKMYKKSQELFNHFELS
jgi:hypothetical protein